MLDSYNKYKKETQVIVGIFRDSYWSNKNDQWGISRKGPPGPYPIVRREVENSKLYQVIQHYSELSGKAHHKYILDKMQNHTELCCL